MQTTDLIEQILKYKSVSFVGMAKNTGKTEALNYVLRALNERNMRCGVTSVGIDGEKQDFIFATSKPEITVYPKTTFITAEKLYPLCRLTSAIKALSARTTALGRLITAEAITKGEVMLAGPASTVWLKEIIDAMLADIPLCLIDGALSRKSLGSPSITDAMILSTGAALSMNIDVLTRKTDFLFRMTQLPVAETALVSALKDIDTGIYAIENNIPHRLPIPSLLMINDYKNVILSHGRRLFIGGILTDNLLHFILSQGDVSQTELTVTDFTKIFSSITQTDLFLQKGGKLQVLKPTNLIAITINPFAPNGFRFDAGRLHNAIAERVNVPVYNVKEQTEIK
ncbi:MAG: hypothetical protein LBR17_03530 [Bacteroidales bacterium]|jgi:hypothetical protein|nr:hypothetical protein [Bacteroidales bacterium]